MSKVISNIFLTGSTGLLGYNWLKYKCNKYIFFASEHKNFINIKKERKFKGSLFNEKKLKIFLKEKKIDIFIHCAALSNVEKCQKIKKKCKLINSILPVKLAKICKDIKIKFIFISSDHIFDGKKKFYSEKSKTLAKNCYAKSKILAEKGILNTNKVALIIRTNFYGKNSKYKKSFSSIIIEKLKKNKKVYLFENVYYTPILIDKLIVSVHRLIDLKKSGIFNICSNQRLSKYSFGVMIAKKLGLSSENIIKIKLESLKKLASRPKDMSLSNKKIKKFLPSHYFDINKNLSELLIK